MADEKPYKSDVDLPSFPKVQSLKAAFDKAKGQLAAERHSAQVKAAGPKLNVKPPTLGKSNVHPADRQAHNSAMAKDGKHNASIKAAFDKAKQAAKPQEQQKIHDDKDKTR